jgi:hypothetical protein
VINKEVNLQVLNLQLISQFEQVFVEYLWLQQDILLLLLFGVGNALFLNKFCLVAVILKPFLLFWPLHVTICSLSVEVTKFVWFDERCLSRIAFPLIPFPNENENDDNVEQS